ncbi:hypothetical protein [uncultured Tenacibaculum sp.]|uniref:hypothetical protein n=1 Tax=uncultured Tenacibaculum sp. TaxID=174713 RepID=UPI00261EE709|nr:hypothetical protein [uncultured Tenacibaculum sp.]
MNLKLKSVFKDVFKNKTICNWFSGFIRINEKNGFQNLEKEESTFIILEFHNGIYVGKRILNYIEFQSFKVAQFKKFKETKNYKLVKENLIKTTGNEYQADTLIVNNILKLINTTF